MLKYFSISLFLFTACQSETPPLLKPQIADVEAGIRTYIEQQAADNNGLFHIQNDSLNLNLKLVRVHTEYLAILSPTEFFACVDLATADGDVYDVDFFMDKNMQVTRQDVHKKNGKPFYTWERQKDNTWKTVPIVGASPDLLGVIQGKDDFTFYYTVTLPELTDNAQLWLPLPQNDRFQKISNIQINLPTAHKFLEEKVFGNQAIYAELTPVQSGQIIEISYQVRRIEKGAYQEDESQLAMYMEDSPLLPVGGRFDSLAQQILAEKESNTPLMAGRALYDYVVDNVRYAKQGKYGTGDANFACDAKSGNCTEFHSLFISLARSAGIPARFAVGAAIPSERHDGGIDGYHCWAEFYAEGKWWPVDISEANKYSNLATYYFGHHPANRIELSKGRDIQFQPGPVSGSISFFAYPILEVNGKSVPVAKTSFSFIRENKKSSS
jgi:hypothetical protein